MLSFALALRYTFAMQEEARLVERAVAGVLDRGLRTADIMQPAMRQVSTTEMGVAIVAELDRLVDVRVET